MLKKTFPNVVLLEHWDVFRIFLCLSASSILQYNLFWYTRAIFGNVNCAGNRDLSIIISDVDGCVAQPAEWKIL